VPVMFATRKKDQEAMSHKKTVAVIGATGNVGSAISKCLSLTSNRLLLMANERDQLELLLSEIKSSSPSAEIEGITCAKEASWEADIIVVATSSDEGKAIAERIREVAIGKIVISVSQPIDGYLNIAANPSNISAAEELQQLLPHSKVVKTFNTAFALDRFTPKSICNFADSFIAGNNGAAVDTVAELVRSAGFNPIPIGDLSASRMLERMQLRIEEQPVKAKSRWLTWWN
jgi:8-hydroxy-5-deazaflavin:NADPH oxidoreductase